MNIMKFFLFSILIFFSIQSQINTWSSYDLWKYIEYELKSNNAINKNYFTMDPNRFLSKNGNYNLNLIEKNQQKLFIETKIPNYIIFISNLVPNEKIEDLAFYVAKNFYLKFPEVNVSNSIISIFSVNDRKMRIRTGSLLKQKISDSSCLEILNNRKKELRKGNYNKVAYDLSNNILDVYNENPYIGLIIIAIIMFVVILIVCYSNNKTKKEKEQLEKIKDYLKRAKTNKKIISESCVICLEEFEKNSKDVSTLPCGHEFHTRCITEWMLKSKKCPLCREEINDLNNEGEIKSENINLNNSLIGESLSERIWEIQRQIFPQFVRYSYSNLWNAHNDNNNNGSSLRNESKNYFLDHDTGGGATADW